MDKDILESVGIDYDELSERFVGATDLFEKFLAEIANSRVIAPLQKALTECKVEEAFRVAHTLKGNFGNLSIKPLYACVAPLVEELRRENIVEAQKLYIDLEKEYEAVVEGIKKAM